MRDARGGDPDYDGKGACPECGGPMGRFREDPWTHDRCRHCRAEWAVRDGRREWIRWE